MKVAAEDEIWKYGEKYDIREQLRKNENAEW